MTLGLFYPKTGVIPSNIASAVLIFLGILLLR